MKINYIQILLLPLIPWALRFLLYWAAFKIRSIHIRPLSCLLVAGASYLLAVIPVQLPGEVGFILSWGLAVFLITRYTEAEVFPDALLIPLVVELVSVFFFAHVVLPLV